MRDNGFAGRQRACARLRGVVAAGVLLGCCGVALGQDEDLPPEVLERLAELEQEAGADGGVAAGDPQNQPLPMGDPDNETVTFSNFSGPVQLSALVEFVAETLGINVTVRGELEGEYRFNAPIEVRKSELIPLLAALLEAYNFSISLDPTGFYTVQPAAQGPIVVDGPLATVEIVATPNVKPTTLRPALAAAIGMDPTDAVVLANDAASLTFIDELGVIMIRASNRKIEELRTLIRRLLEVQARQVLHPIPLRFVAATVARDRALALSGGRPSDGGQGGGRPQGRGPQPQQQEAALGPTLDNLADRLTVAPSGNALIFRGTAEEIDAVETLVSVIDVQSTLVQRVYNAGRTAEQVANLASLRGLGEVTVLETGNQSTQNQFQNFRFGGQQATPEEQTVIGGPQIVVDPSRGSILYSGTTEQQEMMASIIDSLDVDLESIVTRNYPLLYADAEEVSEIITSVVTGEQRAGDSPFLPQGQQNRTVIQTPFGVFGAGGNGEIGDFDPERVFVTADPANNQVIVKAPQGQQAGLEELVNRLDQRRPQVYLEAIIVSVTDNRDFRLAVENQLSVGQFNYRSNFGLSSTQNTGFTDQLTPLVGLPGATSALIMSDQVPFIINAIQTDTDARIESRPQLLVNNNATGTIQNIEEQATVSTSQNGSSTVTSFEEFQEAGTTLAVTPSISADGFIRLEYTITLSNFLGEGTNGVPADRQRREVESAVTVPNDSTIVVGGITVDNMTDTIRKIPLLGDIPLIGQAFRDTQKSKSRQILYIFITPRVLTDPAGRDLRALTRGPYATAELEDDAPPVEAEAIGIIRAREEQP